MSELHDHLAALYAAAMTEPLAPILMGLDKIDEMPLRPAAVLIAVTDRRDHHEGPGVLMIHRPSTMRAHPGQAAFPGGKLDPGETPVEAARREAFEELGIPEDQVRVIGEVDRFVTGTGYDITPVLATIPEGIEVVPNPGEVAAWFEPPFAHVIDPANQEIRHAEFRGKLRANTEIHWNEHRIWGVTGAIIANLARRIDVAAFTAGLR